MCSIKLLHTWGLQQLLVSTMTLHTAFFVFEGRTVFKIFEPVAEGEKKKSDGVNFCFHAVRLQPSSRHFSMRVRKDRGVGTSLQHPPEPTHTCVVSVSPCLLYLTLTQSFVKVKLTLLS